MLNKVTDKDSARVPVPPPLLLLVSLLIGVGIEIFVPLPWVSGGLRWGLGAGLVAAGVAVVLICARGFKSQKTAIEPWKTTSKIVMSGPYQWSRNPIYLSFLVIGLGVSALVNSLWVARMLVPLVLVLTKAVIEREERYLATKFGESYRAYQRRVRRWL